MASRVAHNHEIVLIEYGPRNQFEVFVKALDFVKTPKGNVAIITETNYGGKSASIQFLGKQNPDNEKNAWWDEQDLTVIDSLPHLLALCMAHPFGNGRTDANKFYGDK